jgi:cyclopropane-fatty-acyl-phospholipid synthase
MNSSAEAILASTESQTESAPANTTFYQRLLSMALRGMTMGRLEMHLPSGQTMTFGGNDAGPEARMEVRSVDFFRKCVLFGGVGFGEAYVDGDWDTTDIRAVLEWFILNVRANPQTRGSSQRIAGTGLLRFFNRLQHLLRPNSLKNSRRNISEHYDLGNEFYKLWLDETMTYSAAKFSSADQTLEEAQRAKYDALCQKLNLMPTDHVLEIGCGWGGFSIHAASNYGCRVTAVTISTEQHAEATRRVKEAGLADKISICFQDYRTITGQFDKIASIEMLEAVGDKYLETYFAKCNEVLAPHGLLAFQMITVPDGDYEDLRTGTDWIQKHIFPGSLLLSTGRVNQAINRTGQMFLHAHEDLGSGYARTLREWHVKFNAVLDKVRSQGFSEAFIRKWNYYLKYCEAAFATRNISVVQACYTKTGNLRLHREDGVSA